MRTLPALGLGKALGLTPLPELVDQAGVSTPIDSGGCSSGLRGSERGDHFEDAVGILALGDLDRAVRGDVMEGLANSDGGPVDFPGGLPAWRARPTWAS